MKYDKVIVHCSATPDVDVGWPSRIDVKEIRSWHKDRGWRDVGYHYIITRQGEIQKGRADDETGAHTKGMNDRIGICWVGTKRPNQKQLEAFCTLHDQLQKEYNFHAFDYEPHYKYANKECPGFPIDMLRFMLYLHEKSEV